MHQRDFSAISLTGNLTITQQVTFDGCDFLNAAVPCSQPAIIPNQDDLRLLAILMFRLSTAGQN